MGDALSLAAAPGTSAGAARPLRLGLLITFPVTPAGVAGCCSPAPGETSFSVAIIGGIPAIPKIEFNNARFSARNRINSASSSRVYFELVARRNNSRKLMSSCLPTPRNTFACRSDFKAGACAQKKPETLVLTQRHALCGPASHGWSDL